MMDSFTPWCKSGLVSRLLRWLAVCIWLVGAAAQAQVTTDITQLRLERTDEEWQVSAQLQFELPAAVEDALLKGIPMVFVFSADVLRERWYWWYDKKVMSNERHMRLAYQPLTRHWRLNVSNGPVNSGVGLVLNQSYDGLPQALSAIKRLTKWRVADVADIDSGAKYKLDFRFRLDLAQLPRPFQIGALGQTDWEITASALIPLAAENGK